MTPTTKPSRKTPQRTCCGCREVHDKRDMTRIVRAPDGTVSVDPKGRLAGRGTYICAKPGCWETCLNSNKLEYVLKVKLAPIDRERLMAEGRSLTGGG